MGEQFNQGLLQRAFSLRKRRTGYTLDKLAADAGLSRTAIVRILEVGRGRPENVDKVARALGFLGGRKDVRIRQRSA